MNLPSNIQRLKLLSVSKKSTIPRAGCLKAIKRNSNFPGRNNSRQNRNLRDYKIEIACLGARSKTYKRSSNKIERSSLVEDGSGDGGRGWGSFLD